MGASDGLRDAGIGGDGGGDASSDDDSSLDANAYVDKGDCEIGGCDVNDVDIEVTVVFVVVHTVFFVKPVDVNDGRGSTTATDFVEGIGDAGGIGDAKLGMLW